MRIYLISTEGLEVLKENIQLNLPLYRGEGTFKDLKLVRRSYVDVDGNFDGLDLDGGVKSDAKNAKIIYDALSGITPELARREELWASLTHGELFDYSRSRWATPTEDDDKAKRHVTEHFFAGAARLIESRNAVSRLYWGGLLASRVTDYSMEEVLDTLFTYSDFRQNFVERPSIIQSSSLFSAVIGEMIKSKNNDKLLLQRDINRDFLKEVNHLFGNFAIECLSQKKVNSLVAEVAEEFYEQIS